MLKTASKLFVLEKLVFLAGYAVAGVVAAWFLLASGTINVSLTLSNADVRAEIGHAYIAGVSVPKTPYELMDDRTISSVVELREDGRRLGPPFALHNDIRNRGTGRYSVWGGYLYFSAQDNSNPAVNGRIYTLYGPVVPATRWLVRAGATIVFLAALASILHRLGAQTARPQIAGTGGAAFAVGLLAAIFPVASRASIDPSTQTLIPYLLLLLAAAYLVKPIFLQASPSSLRSPRARFAALAILTIMIFVAVGTSGLLQGRHHANPSEVFQSKSNMYEYRVRGLPFGMMLARDEERTLVNRTLIADANEVLVPGQPEKRIETMPGGLSSFWNRTAIVSYRNPGGATNPSNALNLTGALRIGPNTFGTLLGLVIVGFFWIGYAHRNPQLTPTQDLAPSAHYLSSGIMAGGALGLASIALFFLEPFSEEAATTDLGFATQVRVTHLLTLAASILVLALLPWRARAIHNQSAVAAAILVAALAAPLLGLLDAWLAAGRLNSVSMTALHMLGSMQSSDSFGYLHGALELIATGGLNDWNSRRPLSGTLMTLRVLAGQPDMAAIMLIGALLISAGLMLAAREVLLVTSGWAALAFVVACGAFAAEWAPTTLSEGPGFAMGLFGFAALMGALRRDSLPLFGLGVMVLSIGLMARAGPLLIVPAVIVAGLIIQWRAGRRKMGAWLAVGIAGAVLGLSHSSYLIGLLGGSPKMIQSNFSYTLYGLAVGGKGWMQIFADHPELFTGKLTGPPEPLIYRLAIEEIRTNPSLLIVSLLEELRRVPNFFYNYFDIAVINFWLISGTVIVILSLPSRWAVLGLAAVAGLCLSSPFIMNDGGTRVYAAAVPLMALFVAVGFDTFRRIIALLAIGVAPDKLWAEIRSPCTVVSASHRWPLIDPSAIGALAIIGLILVAPLVIKYAVEPPVGPIDVGPACSPGQLPFVMHSRAMVDIFRVKSESEAGTLVVPDIKRSDLLNAARIHGPVFGQALSRLPPEYTLKAVARVGNLEVPRSVVPTLVGWPVNLPMDRSRPYVAACAVRVGEADSDSIGGLEVYEIKSASPVGFAAR